MGSIPSDLLAIQRSHNERMSAALDHLLLNHQFYGKRRYRRGKMRCQVCGGFLSPQEITLKEMAKMTGMHEALKGPVTVKTVSGRGMQ